VAVDRDAVDVKKDAEAPTLAEAIRAGLVPTYAQCRAHYERQLRVAV